MRTGVTTLPLHGGKAPQWLLKRQKPLAREIVNLIVDEFGPGELVDRLSDPYWFQALASVLAFDWHSSGTTPVTTAVLKWAVKPEEHGLAVCGGKGKTSLKTPQDIMDFGGLLGVSSSCLDELVYSSRLVAKVDNTAVQSGYSLYHHCLVFSESGDWCVVQQGLDPVSKTARRYHWLGDEVKGFVDEPREGVCCDVRREECLNMTDAQSEGVKDLVVDLVNDGPEHLRKYFLRHGQTTLYSFTQPSRERVSLVLPPHANVNWRALDRVYEQDPSDFEGLLSVRGVGPSTVRGLAFVAEVVYGERPSFRDPVKFSYAFGGKDGVPRPVDRRAMDESVSFLKDAVEQAKLGDKQRLRALRGLRRFVPEDREY